MTLNQYILTYPITRESKRKIGLLAFSYRDVTLLRFPIKLSSWLDTVRLQCEELSKHTLTHVRLTLTTISGTDIGRLQ